MNNTRGIIYAWALMWGLLLLGSGSAWAQAPDQSPDVAIEAEPQPSLVSSLEDDEPKLAPQSYSPRQFDENRLDEFRKNPAYKYDRAKADPPDRKKKPREKRTIEETRPPDFNVPKTDFSGLVKGVFWVLIIGLVVFILFQLLKVNWKGLIKKKSDKAHVIEDEEEVPIEEDVTKMEFEDPLQTAIDAGNFRVAVRLLYLQSLRQLSDQRMIVWRREKTNHEYLREISDRNLRAGFSDVTLIFEYIWYGEFPVNKDDFNLARASFLQFEQSLRQNHAV